MELIYNCWSLCYRTQTNNSTNYGAEFNEQHIGVDAEIC